MPALRQRCKVMICIEDLDIRILLDIARNYLAGACHVKNDGLGRRGVQLCNDTFYIKNKFGHVLGHAGNS